MAVSRPSSSGGASTSKIPLWSAKILVETPRRDRGRPLRLLPRRGRRRNERELSGDVREALPRVGSERSESEALLRLSVELVDRARDRFWSEPGNRAGRSFPLVAASVGCYGASLHDGSEYRGDYGLSLKELMDFHRPRLRVLADSGSGLSSRSRPSPRCSRRKPMVALLEELPKAPPVVDQLQLPQRGRGLPRRAARRSASLPRARPGPCSPSGSTARRRTSSPAFWLRPRRHREARASIRTAGRSGMRGVRCGPERARLRIEELAPEWRRLGARLIGGCCRTTPATISELRAALQESRLYRTTHQSARARPASRSSFLPRRSGRSRRFRLRRCGSPCARLSP